MCQPMISGAGFAKITIVVDNRADQGLLYEHGFSAWIEVAGRRLIFDTGQGGDPRPTEAQVRSRGVYPRPPEAQARSRGVYPRPPEAQARSRGVFAGNVEKLDLDLRTADTVVLSHGHYDHTGGLPLALTQAPAAEVYAHPAATGSRYAIRNGVAKTIAMPAAARRALEGHPVGVRWVTEPVYLADGVGITGPIPRLTDYEDTGGPFFVDEGGAHPDPIPDDLALWICTSRGLVVVVGCSHAGLVNTLRHALRVSGERRLHAVLGGFHLTEATEQRLSRSMADLRELDPDIIIPCHCTGDVAAERLRQTFGGRVVSGSAGLSCTAGSG